MLGVVFLSLFLAASTDSPIQQNEKVDLRFQRPLDLEGGIHRFDESPGARGSLLSSCLQKCPTPRRSERS